IARVGFGRVVATVLLNFALQLPVLLGVLLAEGRLPLAPEMVQLGGLAVGIVLTLFCLCLMLRLELGKALLVGLLWGVLTAGYAVAFVFGVRAALIEGLVNPSGGMAETLNGYHKDVTCPQCGYRFAVNSSQEAEPTAGPAVPVVGCTCPNCRFH